MLISIAVGVVGMFFLATSAAMSDLVLNAIALAFILDLDEILYTVFAPRRVHTLMNNIEPLPMPPFRRCIPGLNSGLKMMVAVGGVAITKFLVLDPMFWRLRQAQDILCSGNLEFVYATNPATGMVHVTNTKEQGEWAQSEKTILQVVGPKLEPKYGWEIDQEL